MLERYINKNSYVELVLKDEIPEENLSSGIPFISDKRITILEIYKLIQTIKRSSAEGILVKIKSLNIGYARAFEIRYLLLNLRNAGKKVFIYLEDAGNIEYFIATSADKIFIPPWSTLNLVGLSLENFFLKELLDKLYIEPEIDGFGEYKSAADMFNRKEMSSYHKEMMETVLENHADLSGYDIYVCGPPPMVNAVVKTFPEQGLNRKQLFSDSFEFAEN